MLMEKRGVPIAFAVTILACIVIYYAATIGFSQWSTEAVEKGPATSITKKFKFKSIIKEFPEGEDSAYLWIDGRFVKLEAVLPSWIFYGPMDFSRDTHSVQGWKEAFVVMRFPLDDDKEMMDQGMEFGIYQYRLLDEGRRVDMGIEKSIGNISRPEDFFTEQRNIGSEKYMFRVINLPAHSMRTGSCYGPVLTTKNREEIAEEIIEALGYPVIAFFHPVACR